MSCHTVSEALAWRARAVTVVIAAAALGQFAAGCGGTQPFGDDDERSMLADNTSAFNCRLVPGTSVWAQHASSRPPTRVKAETHPAAPWTSR